MAQPPRDPEGCVAREVARAGEITGAGDRQAGRGRRRQAGRALNGGGGGGGGAERRRDPTTPESKKTYTKKQFAQFYGGSHGAKMWKKAGNGVSAQEGAADPKKKGPAGAPPAVAADGAVFAAHGAATVRVLARYLDALTDAKRELPVEASLKPGELAKLFGTQVPEEPTPFAELLRDFDTKVVPGVTQWQHPRFMAYYPSSSSLPAIIGEMMIAAIGSVGLQWSANPVATELEVVVMDWLAQMTAKKGGDDVTRKVAAGLSARGFFSIVSKLGETPHLRVALGGVNTTMDDVRQLWAAMQEEHAKV